MKRGDLMFDFNFRTNLFYPLEFLFFSRPRKIQTFRKVGVCGDVLGVGIVMHCRTELLTIVFELQDE